MKQYFSFQWHITDECDQRCKHCYIFSADPGKDLYSMPYSQMLKVIDNCVGTNSMRMRKRAASLHLIAKTISGHCMSMKREDLKSQQMPSRELFTADVTAAIAT